MGVKKFFDKKRSQFKNFKMRFKRRKKNRKTAEPGPMPGVTSSEKTLMQDDAFHNQNETLQQNPFFGLFQELYQKIKGRPEAVYLHHMFSNLILLDDEQQIHQLRKVLEIITRDGLNGNIVEILNDFNQDDIQSAKVDAEHGRIDDDDYPVNPPKTQSPPPLPPTPPPPPPLPSCSAAPPPPDLLPQTGQLQDIKSKCNVFQWQKFKQVGDHSIWHLIIEENNLQPPIFNGEKLEELFARVVEPLNESALRKRGRKRDVKRREFKLMECYQLKLLIDLFLNTSRRSTEDILDRIQRCDFSFFTIEQINRLEEIISNYPSEIHKLKGYRGDTTDLQPPERFLLKLLAIPGYDALIRVMLFKIDLYPSISEMESRSRLLLSTCETIMENKSLLNFMAVVLQIGNFLNQGISFAGNAKGFKLSALKEMTEYRARNSQITLLHYIVSLEEDNPNLLEFTSQLSCIDEAKKIGLEDMVKEIGSWRSKIEQARDSLNSNTDGDKFITDFLKEAWEKLNDVNKLLLDARNATRSIIRFFNEDPKELEPVQFFILFSDFFASVKKARQENIILKVQEAKAKK